MYPCSQRVSVYGGSVEAGEIFTAFNIPGKHPAEGTSHGGGFGPQWLDIPEGFKDLLRCLDLEKRMHG